MAEVVDVRTPELIQLVGNKDDGYTYRQPRHAHWTENYTLYKDEVQVNRITQRQSVNVPMMKQQITSLLKDVDDLPVIYFEELNNDLEKQGFINEYWKFTGEYNNIELRDIVDKKQVFLFGRTFDQWQVVDGKIKQTIIDPQDILVSRFTDPADLHTSRFLIHTHIFKPLSELENDPKYDKDAIKRLKEYYKGDTGLKKISDNETMAVEKSEKLAALGLQNELNPDLGEVIVELNYHFVYDTKEGDKEEQLFLKIEADSQEIIYSKPLEEVIGVTEDHWFRNHFPYETWTEDIERQYFWSDGKADIIRTPNTIQNVYWSQTVENRTLINYNMNFYDSTNDSFQPSTFNPVPWGWYPLPGKPSEVYQPVQVQELKGSLDELQYLVEQTERATGATATQQGVQTQRQVTLGEVQLALGEAKERSKGMTKFYTSAWKRRATLFLKLLEAAGDKLDAVMIYKKGRNTDRLFPKEIGPADWKSKAGYHVQVWSQDDKNKTDDEMLQKLNAAVTLIPGNMKLIDVYQRKLLEFAHLSPEETMGVLEEERAKREQQALLATQGGQPGMMPLPVNPGQPAVQPAPAPVIRWK